MLALLILSNNTVGMLPTALVRLTSLKIAIN